jgi:hypothetical protein
MSDTLDALTGLLVYFGLIFMVAHFLAHRGE